MTPKTAEQLAQFIHLLWPIQAKNHFISQKFGENKLPLYRAIGLKGHNGEDYICPTGTPILASFDGVVTVAYHGLVGYGYEIRVESKTFKVDEQNCLLEAIYGHNSRLLVKEGERVSEGQVIAYSGNTGYSTAPHSHFEIRVKYESMGGIWVRDVNNGYFGAVNPELLLESKVSDYQILNYPVQDKYGFSKIQWREAFTRFKSPSIHTALLKNGRTALSLTNEELNALCYGKWTIQDILAPTFPLYWQQMSYSTFKARAFEHRQGQREKVI